MTKVTPGLSRPIILDIVYFLILPFLLLIYIARRKFHSKIIDRVCLGRWRNILKEKKSLIWIHAVSLGEAKLAIIIYQILKSSFPEYKFLLTAITPAGEKLLSQHIKVGDYLAYLPLDFSFFMRHLLSELNVEMILILETEIWPNLIIEAKKRGVRVGLINARISKKAFPRYKFLKPLITKILNLFDFVCLSGKIAQKRFRCLGLKQENSYLVGSLKFDLEILEVKKDSRIEDLKRYLEKNGCLLFIAGSTHPIEDILVFQAYQRTFQNFPKIKFLIAPRHINKLSRFIKCILESGYRVEYFSRGFNFWPERNIFLIDELTYLASLYQLADMVFVGGSLVPYGGHNIIEPALFKKPIIIGRYYHNFEEIVSEFITNRAILICHDEIQLQKFIEQLADNERFRLELGLNAYQAVLNNRGALGKTIDIISSEIK